MVPAELLKKVRKIEIKTKGLSNHLFSGEYHTAFKGRGMSFSEVRAYQYGDDVRQIDWNVTARTGDAHVKVFEEERELNVMLLVDSSKSMCFGTGAYSKKEIMTEIAAIMAFSALQNNDKVGVIFFSDTIEKFIPPKKGRQHILRIIRELVEFQPISAKTDVNLAFQFLQNVMKKRTVTFLLSDFQCGDFARSLQISARRNDIIGIRVFDQMEEFPPKRGLVRVSDLENGQEEWVDFSNVSAHVRHRSEYLKRVGAIKDAFSKAKASCIDINSHRPYIQTLLTFFKNR